MRSLVPKTWPTGAYGEISEYSISCHLKTHGCIARLHPFYRVSCYLCLCRAVVLFSRKDFGTQIFDSARERENVSDKKHWTVGDSEIRHKAKSDDRTRTELGTPFALETSGTREREREGWVRARKNSAIMMATKNLSELGACGEKKSLTDVEREENCADGSNQERN